MTANRDLVIRVTGMPADDNGYADIFGGWLMSLMNMGAGRRQAGSEFTFLHRPVRAKSAP